MLLKATYKFPVTIMLNKVPVFLYFVTHAYPFVLGPMKNGLIAQIYFMSYHAFTSPIIRRFKASFAPGAGRIVATAILVFGLSYFTAFMEAWTMEKVCCCFVGLCPMLCCVGAVQHLLNLHFRFHITQLKIEHKCT